MDQITGVVNMCDEYYGPVAEYEKRHMKQIYLPTGIQIPWHLFFKNAMCVVVLITTYAAPPTLCIVAAF